MQFLLPPTGGSYRLFILSKTSTMALTLDNDSRAANADNGGDIRGNCVSALCEAFSYYIYVGRLGWYR